MMPFSHSDIHAFVFIYNTSAVSSKSLLIQLEDILQKVGFVLPDGRPVRVVPAEAREDRGLSAPLPVLLNGGEAFLDWKLLPELEGPAMEVQIGAATSIDTGMFSDVHYSPEMRDRLVAGLEELCSPRGFSLGFEVGLGSEFASEGVYREYFQECIIEKRVSLGRLVHHEYLPLWSLFVGQPYLDLHDRETFLRCPAWRVSQPSNDAVCVFLYNLFPTDTLMVTHGQFYVREGLAHLRNALSGGRVSE